MALQYETILLRGMPVPRQGALLIRVKLNWPVSGVGLVSADLLVGRTGQKEGSIQNVRKDSSNGS